MLQANDVIWLGAPTSNRMNGEAVLTARNDVSELSRLNEFLCTFWAANHLSEDLAGDFELALEEVFMNIVRHGYRDGGEHPIRVRIALEDDVIVLAIEDQGIPFNPLEVPEVNVELMLQERPVGGLGIHLVRTIMDSVEYARVGESNRLVMKKRMNPRRSV